MTLGQEATAAMKQVYKAPQMATAPFGDAR